MDIDSQIYFSQTQIKEGYETPSISSVVLLNVSNLLSLS